ncbi:SDR family NAD(P)-dependent oxidoreductase [Nocardioides lianchengensis]|uniref:NADP-dependent 3-hydroxy acid dehydrogenase YdfG n=1 Tax=Nocardioides lianchengensis TaxID=1045774 RepID=A0A1G6US08_9ACTN|nr:SDR family NAD(P)-dependent oxidoreductase [Nocardioides lianchengensis]NYG11019.1 NAD(P)-dependent dehydrogenase (short-subunit alcohol dehydrogenase family) [Nocardioides lianchengensis]SDD44071.1 NADP-dependent 3-hydroxy acid dehydrogenase YdfG [Nocardioides lianchengensis]
MSTRAVVVVGAGPGVSGSLARRYAADGWSVGLVGRNVEQVALLAEELGAAGVRVETEIVDMTGPEAADAVRRVAERLGRVDVLHFNPSAFRERDPLELSVPDLLADVALGVGALLTAVQAVRPLLVEGGRITVTGSMAADRPWHRAASLGVQKAGVRNLVHSLDATLRDDGIRAVSVTVNGTLGDDGPFSPDRVAEALVAAARQDEGDWRTEVPYDG